MKTLTQLNPLDMAWILLLFEGGTLFVMSLILQLGLSRMSGITNDVVLGAGVGVLGTIIALLLWNRGLLIRGTLDGSGFTLTRISILPASIANAAFLIVLFIVEDRLTSVRSIPGIGIALLGFCATGLALLILFFLYNFLPLKLRVIMGRPTAITRITPLRAALIAGMYEAIILPLMALLFMLPFPMVFTYTVTGMGAGFIGGLVGTFIFNLIAPVLKPGLELR
jgi:hypothetical protein